MADFELAAIVESSDDAIIGQELDGTIVTWNAGAEVIYGYSAQEAIGRTISFIHPPERPNDLARIFDKIKSGERVRHYDTVRVRKDGRRVDISLTVSPVRDRQGRIVGASGIGRDVTERKRLEEQVRRQSEAVAAEYERLANIVAHMDVLLAVMDTQGRLTMVNDAWLRLAGLERSQESLVIGRRYDEMGEHPAITQTQAATDQVLATGQPAYVRELYYEDSLHPEGIYGDSTFQPLHDAAGNVTGVVGVSIEVGEKVRARQSVEAQKALLETIIAGSPVGIVMYDRDMRITHYNAEYARISRLDAEQIKGRVLYELAPATLSRKPLHQRVLAGESIDQQSVPHVETHGNVSVPDEEHTRYTDIGYRPIRDASGEIVGILSTVVDVTARAHAQKEIEAQRAVLEAVIQATPIGLAHFDCEMRVLDINPAYAKIAHLDRTTARGKNLYDLAPEVRAREELHRRALAGESLGVENLPHRDPVDKQTHYLNIYYRPVKDAGGEIIGMVSAVVDVTQQRELDRQKDEFLSLASHELRTPVTSIKGFAQLALRIAKESTDSRLSGYLHRISTQADHLTRLIADLLDVSQLEAGALPLHVRPTDLAVLVREAVSDCRHTAPEFAFSLELPPEPVIVEADPDAIGQVLSNLLGNAIKYSRYDRRIEVAVGVGAVVTIRDFGMGIPLDQQSKVFDRFYRASNAGHQPRNGLGLGLYLSRAILERHGGRIWLESALGRGSTFYFALPLKHEDR